MQKIFEKESRLVVKIESLDKKELKRIALEKDCNVSELIRIMIKDILLKK